jgi:DNA polymerase I-like protein with 3'-5' exonuclease and polymerase domains
MIRTIFIPEFGEHWLRYDYSQIEYRVLVHFAVGGGAEEARQMYLNDPSTDYHAAVQAMLLEKVNRELDRKPTKNINFGLIYGMGEPKLARMLNLPLPEARRLFKDLHEAVPYAKATMDHIIDLAGQQGYIETILGRRSRFDLWESTKYNDYSIPTTLDKAVQVYGTQIKRSGLHKALNRLLQGSAADLIKLSMLTCYENGLFQDDTVPLLTVHDELDFSAQDPRAPVWNQIKEVMETVLPIRVPVTTEIEVGSDWGNLKQL